MKRCYSSNKLISRSKFGKSLYQHRNHHIGFSVAALFLSTTYYAEAAFHSGAALFHRTPFRESTSFAGTTKKMASSGVENDGTSKFNSAILPSVPISPRILETLDPCVVLMKDMVGQYTSLWEDKGGIYSLAQGVVYWDPPATCQQALVEALQDPDALLHTYGPAQGIPQLVDAIQNKLAAENEFPVSSNVMVTVGANQAYVNCVLTCLNEDSKAIVFSPFYFNHVMAIQMTCGEESVVVGPSSSDGVPDIEWLARVLEEQNGAPMDKKKKIDMVTIVNPGNPTGVSLTRDQLQKMVDICEKYQVWLVLDCTYEYFATPPGHQPLATFPDAPHVIHIFSFSKSYSLAGYRCGYLVMHSDQSHAWTNMLKVQDTLPIGPPRLSQIAAFGALQAGREWVYTNYDTLKPSREAIIRALDQSLEQTMGGTGAMYVMGKLPKEENGGIRDDVEICRKLVEDYGVAIIPGSFCGFPGWIRVCYANLKPNECLKAAERLKNGLLGILQTDVN